MVQKFYLLCPTTSSMGYSETRWVLIAQQYTRNFLQLNLLAEGGRILGIWHSVTVQHTENTETSSEIINMGSIFQSTLTLTPQLMPLNYLYRCIQLEIGEQEKFMLVGQFGTPVWARSFPRPFLGQSKRFGVQRSYQIHFQDRFCTSKKVGHGWVSAQGTVHMAATLAGCRMSLVGTGWATSPLVSTNRYRNHSHSVRARGENIMLQNQRIMLCFDGHNLCQLCSTNKPFCSRNMPLCF